MKPLDTWMAFGNGACFVVSLWAGGMSRDSWLMVASVGLILFSLLLHTASTATRKEQ